MGTIVSFPNLLKFILYLRIKKEMSAGLDYLCYYSEHMLTASKFQKKHHYSGNKLIS